MNKIPIPLSTAQIKMFELKEPVNGRIVRYHMTRVPIKDAIPIDIITTKSFKWLSCNCVMKRLLLLLLLFSSVFCAEILEPKLVKSIDADINDNGKVTVIDGSAHYIQLNLTLPQNTDYQFVEYGGETSTDSDGNSRVNIITKKPSNPFDYSISARVETSERKTNFLPTEYKIPTNYQRYLESSELAQSDNDLIKQKALELTQDYGTDFEKVAALAIFVNNYLEYDWDILGQKKDALWVLENKKGVCVEYSNLFSALAKSLGFPTRYVLGQAYGKYGWLGHAWSEVYIGEWVPVDATWLEVGHLDATHIPFVMSPNPLAESRIYTQVTTGATVDWQKHSFYGSNSNYTQIIPTNVEYNNELVGYNLQIGMDDLGFGEKTVVYLEYSISDYRVIDLKLIPCQSDPAIITTPKQQDYMITEPNEKGVVYWVLETSKGLSPDSIYTCPLTLNSEYLEESIVDVKTRKKDKSRFTASLGQTVIARGEELEVNVEAENNSVVTVIMENTVRTIPLTSGSGGINLTPEKVGAGKLVVFSDKGGAQELEYRIEETTGALSITSVVVPEKVSPSTVSVKVMLENKGESENIELTLEAGAYSETQKFSLGSSAEKAFDLDLQDIGTTTVTVSLKNNGVVVDEHQVVVNVYGEGIVDVTGQEYTDGILTVYLEEHGDIKNLRIEKGTETFAVEQGRASFAFQEGESFTLEWEDSAGQTTSQTRSVVIEKDEKVMISQEMIMILTAAIVVIILVVGVLMIVQGKRKSVSQEVEERLKKK